MFNTFLKYFFLECANIINIMLRIFLLLFALGVTRADKTLIQLSNGTDGCTYFKPCVKKFDTPKKVQVKCTEAHVMIKTCYNEEDVRVECSEIADVTSYIYVTDELTAVSPNNGAVYVYIKDV